MQARNVFLALLVLCGTWNVTVSLIIYGALTNRGVPVSFIWLRLLAPKYAFQYKQVTQSETGKAGSLFYQWIISINLALVFAILAIVSLI